MLEEKYVNPFTDFGFKKLFGSEVNKKLIIDFLNEIIQDQGRIVDLTFLRNEQTGRSESDRRAIFDIYCENEKGEKFIVEMQQSKLNYYLTQNNYYSYFPIHKNIKNEKFIFTNTKIIMLGIIDFNFTENANNKKNIYKFENVFIDSSKNNVLMSYIIEIPNFNKKENELETKLDKWLYLIKNLPDLDERPEKLNDKVFDQLFQVAELAKFTYKEMLDYEYSLKAFRDNINTMDYAMKEAYKKGYEEGIELAKQVLLISNCIKNKIPLETIAQITGLSIVEMENIINENKLS